MMTFLHSRQVGSSMHGWRAALGEPALGWRQREPRLWAFGLLMLLLMLPAALALGLDDRVLRGVSVWVKPLKFMASSAVLALTTAWFFGHLPAAVRSTRAARVLVGALIASAGFEVGYITLQSALGQASHYNIGSAFHATMYSLMGLAALVLTATQPALAWLIWKHGERQIAAPYRAAVITGLVLTFVLGAGAGALLGGLQPPATGGLPIIGWSLAGGDLRIAHFIGIHAAQVLPALGVCMVLARVPAARAWVYVGSTAWALLWATAFVHALMTRGLATAI
jgi:hypothetical protein